MGLLSKKDTASDDDADFDFHLPSSDKALIIFTRNPELGKCKTRLATTIGDEAALEVYKFLLNHTCEISKKTQCDRFVFYSENILKNDIWDAEYFHKRLQKGTDLGERMNNAFETLFGMGYQKVCIIGSDLLDLNVEHINEAFYQLENHDAVLGPAKDGGYYLFAMDELLPKVFINKKWGTDSVLSETLQDLQNYDVHLLTELNDIDTFEDMQHYPQLKQFYIPKND